MEKCILDNKFEVLFDFSKKSFEEIIAEVAEEEITPVEEFSVDDDKKLSVLIGLSGETNGRILLETSVEHGTNIAVAMNFGDELDSEDDLYMYLAEFSNMFCGRAATYINDKFGKREVWLSPPAIFSAQDLEVVTPNVKSYRAFYNCSLGKFIVDTGFGESVSSAGDDSDYGGF